MLEFWIEHPVLEMMFGIVSFLGVVLLGWSNLHVDPPNTKVSVES